MRTATFKFLSASIALLVMAISIYCASLVFKPFGNAASDYMRVSAIVNDGSLLAAAQGECARVPGCKGVSVQLIGDTPTGGLSLDSWRTYFAAVHIDAQGPAYAGVVAAATAKMGSKETRHVRFVKKG